MNIPLNVGPNENHLVLLSFSPSQGEPTITHFGNHRSQPSTLDGVFGMVPKVLGAKKSMANLIFLHVSRQCKLPTHNTSWVQNNFYFPWGFCFLCLMTSVRQRFSFQCVGRAPSIPKIRSFLPDTGGHLLFMGKPLTHFVRTRCFCLLTCDSSFMHYNWMGVSPEFHTSLVCCLGWTPYSSNNPFSGPYLPASRSWWHMAFQGMAWISTMKQAKCRKSFLKKEISFPLNDQKLGQFSIFFILSLFLLSYIFFPHQ